MFSGEIFKIIENQYFIHATYSNIRVIRQLFAYKTKKISTYLTGDLIVMLITFLFGQTLNIKPNQ